MAGPPAFARPRVGTGCCDFSASLGSGGMSRASAPRGRTERSPLHRLATCKVAGSPHCEMHGPESSRPRCIWGRALARFVLMRPGPMRIAATALVCTLGAFPALAVDLPGGIQLHGRVDVYADVNFT